MSRADAVILSFSRVARDWRVLRQGALLVNMGLTTCAVGFGEPDDAISLPFCSYPEPRPTWQHRLPTVLRQLPAHLPRPWGEAAAGYGFWAAQRHRWALGRLREIRPRLVLANDWPALVVAARWRAETGAAVHYDSHEFSVHEFDDRPWWRLVHKPFVTHLERAAIGAADSVSTVGPSLARALQDLYGLHRLPATVRSVPEKHATFREEQTFWPPRLLYHGLIRPDRGIDMLILALAALPERNTLLIRGSGPDQYLCELKNLAAEAGVAGLVRFEPSVEPWEVVDAAAASSDVGVFTPPLRTPQQRLSLPNKLFEYIAAGLAVVVSPGDDLKELVETYGVGVVSRDAGVEAIAAAIARLTPEVVARFKAASRAAARELVWEHEKRRLAEVLHGACARAGLAPRWKE
ncbi:glycosyltransferase [Phreatobacter sp.]|uniref:glycosyltransferase n=1 Tax=Phreatobacter sp. TaxID=1966341 RepID=UPI0022C4761F|nr:glycosyltransferase [Phreatobacter sp.]MCZ8316887.1 glycosyltransferase [Phreatobacter sp.]